MKRNMKRNLNLLLGFLLINTSAFIGISCSIQKNKNSITNNQVSNDGEEEKTRLIPNPSTNQITKKEKESSDTELIKPKINKPQENKNSIPQTKPNNKNNINNDVDRKDYSDRHLFSLEFLQNNNPYQIIKQTPSYINTLKDLNNFLKNEKINFRDYYGEYRKKELNDKFWNYTNKIGHYNNFGEDDKQKVEWYNDQVSKNGMIKQKYLDKFENKNNFEALNYNFNDLISKNPFGFLPSNLSQLFYYMNFDSIKKLFNLSNDVKNIKANFDDSNGWFELLITTTNNKNFYIKIDTNSTQNLKKDLDYYQFIYDHTFMLKMDFKRWDRNPYTWEDKIVPDFKGGTMWVVDRIVNDDEKNSDYWDLLFATNIHVFTLNKAFDRSLYFNKDSNHSDKNSWHEYVKFENNNYNMENRYNDSSQPMFWTLKTNSDKLALKYNDDQTINKWVASFEAKQYLDAPYYTPRYTVSGIKTKTVDDAKLYFEKEFDDRMVETKNGGADFVLLRLKIKKEILKYVLPALDKVIGKPEEKTWHIGVGKKEKFSPLKTQFYAGYPDYKFKGNKSTGGIISASKRYVDADDFQSLWVKYNENENKDWNSHNQKYQEYTEPFKEQNEHGMRKQVLIQHSTLWTKIDNKEDVLDSGSSGSMAIDSSFNLIGINYLHTTDSYNNTITNGINLMEGNSTYKNGFDGDLRNDIKNKLIKDKLNTIVINPKK
ncbi:MAG2960 family serine endopeptidase lipoprotein [Metamycoplasma alkalescens]|nr:lipoprotein [Metamycoplasma alkalescens]